MSLAKTHRRDKPDSKGGSVFSMLILPIAAPPITAVSLNIRLHSEGKYEYSWSVNVVRRSLENANAGLQG